VCPRKSHRVPTSAHMVPGLAAQLLQEILSYKRDPQPALLQPPLQPPPSTSGPLEKPEKRFGKVPNPAKPSTHGHHPKPQPAELSTVPKPYDEHTSLDLAMGLKNRWDSYIQIRVAVSIPALSDIHLNILLRTGFGKSSSALGSIGRGIGGRFLHGTRQCSLRW
jgi:hypothetical protein